MSYLMFLHDVTYVWVGMYDGQRVTDVIQTSVYEHGWTYGEL